MAFPNIIHGSIEETYKTYSTEKVPVGTKMVTEDGSSFRFAEAGGVALIAGKVLESTAPSANFRDEAVDTMDAGVTVLTGVGATTGSCAIDLVKYGYAWSVTATCLNPIMRIKSNTLCTLAEATGTITLFHPTPVAIAAAATISYVKNPWRDVVITTNATPLSMVAGIPAVACALDYFCWLQTEGPCVALTGGTMVIGCELITTSTAGTLGPNDSETTQLTKILGHCMETVTSGERGLVWLTLE